MEPKRSARSSVVARLAHFAGQARHRLNYPSLARHRFASQLTVKLFSSWSGSPPPGSLWPDSSPPQLIGRAYLVLSIVPRVSPVLAGTTLSLSFRCLLSSRYRARLLAGFSRLVVPDHSPWPGYSPVHSCSPNHLFACPAVARMAMLSTRLWSVVVLGLRYCASVPSRPLLTTDLLLAFAWFPLGFGLR
ncbi:hypothetical protein NL676_034341 [Syzygium grande]|nr:hypothetical protein NL676_034341 [Syzygium grande]